MESKFKIDERVMCDGRECTVLDKTWVVHMDEYEYLLGWNEEFCTTLERNITPCKV